jgi:uncharacterized membrane protein YphA (DoxX/SURF4 family)
MAGAAAKRLVAARLAAGAVFVLFGLGKFVNHGAELASFKSYGLPAPEVAVYAVGVLEIVGGALLIVGRAILPVAVLLAADMLVAIAVAGIGRGEVIPSLTLAPVLLGVMVVLAWDQRRFIVAARELRTQHLSPPHRPRDAKHRSRPPCGPT